MILLLACTNGDRDSGSFDIPFDGTQTSRILQMGPLGAPPPDPTNAWADDEDAARFGQFVYFDPRFSQDGTVACSSCHLPDEGFSDGLTLSQGIDETDRHTPSVWNTAWNRWFFWDGHADSLWAQALGPLVHPAEMGSSRDVVATRVSEAYADEYTAIFGAFDDPTTTFVNVGKAIAAYEACLELRPEDEDAEANRDLAQRRYEELLEQAQDDQQEQEEQQEQQDE